MSGQKFRKQHRKNNEITRLNKSILLNKIKDSSYAIIALWCSGNMPAFGASVSGSTPLRAVYHRKIIFLVYFGTVRFDPEDIKLYHEFF
jgi:hypothetical protein